MIMSAALSCLEGKERALQKRKSPPDGGPVGLVEKGFPLREP
jgi:hypothetical protein